jgi:hypothetical protein
MAMRAGGGRTSRWGSRRSPVAARVDWRDNTLCRFDDLAGIQAQIFAEAGRWLFL